MIGELRIFPDSPELPNREPGTWAGDFLGRDAKCPRGGVTARLLRHPDLKVGTHLRAVPMLLQWARRQRGQQRVDQRRYAEHLEIVGRIDPDAPVLPPSSGPEWAKDFHDELRAMGLEPSTPAARSRDKRRGRPGRDDRFYALLAEAYVARLDAGSTRPNADLAVDAKLRARLGVSTQPFQRSHARDAIRIAREKGLLSGSDAGKGKPGGALTQRARELLRQRDRRPTTAKTRR